MNTLATKSDVADLSATITNGTTSTIKINAAVVIVGLTMVIVAILFASIVLFSAINRITPLDVNLPAILPEKNLKPFTSKGLGVTSAAIEKTKGEVTG